MVVYNYVLYLYQQKQINTQIMNFQEVKVGQYFCKSNGAPMLKVSETQAIQQSPDLVGVDFQEVRYHTKPTNMRPNDHIYGVQNTSNY